MEMMCLVNTNSWLKRTICEVSLEFALTRLHSTVQQYNNILLLLHSTVYIAVDMYIALSGQCNLGKKAHNGLVLKC